MKIILYANRNVGLCALSYLVALGHDVKFITEDENVRWLADTFGLWELSHIWGEYDLFICVHGRRIIPKEQLSDGKMINIHPTKYNGHDPVRQYMFNDDTQATIRAMYMTEKVDEGELIAEESFETPVCREYSTFYNIALPYYFKIIDKVLKIVS